MRKNGFTLSEVLIVLAIIGIVSILTIPSFIKNYKTKIYSAKISKIYSQIEDAVQSAMSDEHSSRFSTTDAGGSSCLDAENCAVDELYFLDNYFKVVKSDCKATCMASSYQTPAAANAGAVFTSFTKCSKTISGAVLCKYTSTTETGEVIPSTGEGTQLNTSYIAIDTNGVDGPNITGYDFFVVKINDDGSVEDLDTSDKCNTSSTGVGSSGAEKYASGCLAKLRENHWKINY